MPTAVFALATSLAFGSSPEPVLEEDEDAELLLLDLEPTIPPTTAATTMTTATGIPIFTYILTWTG